MPIQAMRTAASGMKSAQGVVDTIAQNMANPNTTGYKAMKAVIKDTAYITHLQPGTASSDTGTTIPSGIQIGTGSKLAATTRILSQGQITSTQGDLDLAVNGRGYFQIDLPNGNTAYTRDGNFSRNENGEIVTQEGYLVQPGITIPINATKIDINKDGEVWIKTDDAIAPTNAGQIQLAKFINPNGLEAIGNNLFLESVSSGTAVVAAAGSANYGTIAQGGLEGSNVEVVEELTDLIAAQRGYELNGRVITTSDQMLAAIAQLR